MREFCRAAFVGQSVACVGALRPVCASVSVLDVCAPSPCLSVFLQLMLPKHQQEKRVLEAKTKPGKH